MHIGGIALMGTAVRAACIGTPTVCVAVSGLPVVAAVAGGVVAGAAGALVVDKFRRGEWRVPWGPSTPDEG